MSEAPVDETVLDVKGLQTVFFTASGLFKAVDNVSFNVRRGETLAIAGLKVQVLRADSRRVYTLIVEKPKT